MSPAQIKLTYFPITGRAELARLLFTYGGVAFEDNRVAGPVFGAMKPTLPLGQLPVLEVDGVVYAQSMAIARYAAKASGLYPEDAAQALRVDMVSETLVDLLNVFIDIKFKTSDETLKAEKSAKFVAEGLPKSLATLEGLVQSKYFVGDSATLADVQLFDIAHNALKPSFPELSMAAYPKLEAIVEAVKVNANIAAYLSK
ncbi:Hematopoietic prostaglandin d synthase [Globisporangium polare]